MHILLCLCLIFTVIYGPSSVAGDTGNRTGDIDWTQDMAKFQFTEIADLKRRLESLESNSDERQARLHAKIKELQERLEQKECKCNDEKLAPRAIVVSDLHDIGIGMTIIYDNILTNIGGRYNGKTGIFYCDKPGLYFFSTTVLVSEGKYVEVELVVNGIEKFPTIGDARGIGDHDTGSNSGVLQLQTGDSVWVRVRYRLIGDTDNIIHAEWTTFTGYFISDIS